MKVYRVKHATKQLFAHQDAGHALTLPHIVRQPQNASIFTDGRWAAQVAQCMTRNKGGEWVVEEDDAFEDKKTKKGPANARTLTIERDDRDGYYDEMTIDFHLEYLPRAIAAAKNRPDSPIQQKALLQLQAALAFWQIVDCAESYDPGVSGLNGQYSPPEDCDEEEDDDELPF